MLSNINPLTGIAYGVLSANTVSWLYDEIVANGEDLTYNDMVTRLRESLASIFEDFDEDELPSENRMDAVREGLAAELVRRIRIDKPTAEDLAACGMEHFDMMSKSFDVDEAVRDLADQLSDQGYFEDSGEHEYTWKDGEVTYSLGYLGGAPLIWVIESPYVTWCAPCSPCVRNAGDLDNVREEGQGLMAYCPPPADWKEAFEESACPVTIRLLSEVGA